MRYARLLETVLSVLIVTAPTLGQALYVLPYESNRPIPDKVFDLSSDGSVAVGRRWNGTTNEAFSWSITGGLVALGYTPSNAHGVSGNGLNIVGEGTDGETVAIHWAASGPQILSSLPGGGTHSARAASSDGSTVVGYVETSDGHLAATWTGSAVQTLPQFGAPPFDSRAVDVSADGTIVIGHESNSTSFFWIDGTGPFQVAPLPGGVSVLARSVSADGSTIVGQAAGANGDEAFRWTAAEGTVGLGDLPGGGYGSDGRGVSANGNIVVGWGIGEVGTRPFIWMKNIGMRDLQSMLIDDFGLAELLGWSSVQPFAISADASVVAGNGINPQGEWQAWVAVVPALCRPFVDSQPTSAAADLESLVQFTVETLSASPAAYQWRHDGMPLVDGPGTLGSLTDTLTVTADIGAIGVYDCVVTNDCGSVVSIGAVLAVRIPTCPGDTDFDSDVDVFDFNILASNFGRDCLAE